MASKLDRMQFEVICTSVSIKGCRVTANFGDKNDSRPTRDLSRYIYLYMRTCNARPSRWSKGVKVDVFKQFASISRHLLHTWNILLVRLIIFVSRSAL